MTPFAVESRSTTDYEKPTTYRGAAALIGGALVVLFCGIGAIDLIVESGTRDLNGASILLLVAVLAGLYGVYPAAFAWSDRLVVRNPFRTIELPWTAVTDLSARLSFIAHSEAKRFTVWAIPVSLRERRRVDRHRVRDLNQAQRAVKRGMSPDLFQPSRGHRPYDPVDRMSFADQAIAEMNAKREAYIVQARLKAKADAAEAAQAQAAQPGSDSAASIEPSASVETTASVEEIAVVGSAIVRWSWPSIALLGASVAFLIAAFSLH
jgi:hypothetical protein